MCSVGAVPVTQLARQGRQRHAGTSRKNVLVLSNIIRENHSERTTKFSNGNS